ncbi:MAG: hypothetical protein AAGE80_15315 [Pseudomonadota bacterium]
MRFPVVLLVTGLLVPLATADRAFGADAVTQTRSVSGGVSGGISIGRGSVGGKVRGGFSVSNSKGSASIRGSLGNRGHGFHNRYKSTGRGLKGGHDVYKPKEKFPKRRPFFGTFCCDFTPREETVVIVKPPAPPPEPPEEVVEVTPPPPPDPRGPRFERARIPGRSDLSYAVGDRVPRREPVVTLDWRRFDLPEPDSGTTYVRVGREVLVMDVFTREVLQIATPG